MNRSLLIAAASLALTAAAAAPNTPTPMPEVKAEMAGVVDKTSTDLFNAAGAADPSNGADQKVPDAVGWAKIKADADKLKEAGDWLQKAGIGKTTEANWMRAAQDMAKLSAAASKAAADHDAKTLAQAANDLSDTCTACHRYYKKQD